MAWETRPNGRRYLYRSVRTGAAVSREYLAADDAFGRVMAAELAASRRRAAAWRAAVRAAKADARDRVRRIDLDAAAADAELRTAIDAVMTAVGYYRHRRGEWRMRRGPDPLAALTAATAAAATPRPLLRFDAAGADAAATDVFARARAGDAAAAADLRALIRANGWADWIGGLGAHAAHQIIRRMAGGDPVFAEGVGQRADAIFADLAGPNPTLLEKLLVRRVVNGWLHVHALELELAVRPPADAVARATLDKALSRAESRFGTAARELARVRRLQAPRVVAKWQLRVVEGAGDASAGRPGGGAAREPRRVAESCDSPPESILPP